MPQSIILMSDVPGLGQIGEIHKVKDGYARNYLLPQRLAVLATPNGVKRVEKQKEKLATERAKQLSASQGLAEKVSKVGLVFERPVGPGGRLFGSVTSLDIVSEFSRQGVTVEKKSVLMDMAIKTLGDHVVRVRIHSKVAVDVPVKIIGVENKKDQEVEEEIIPPETWAKADAY